MYLAMGASGRGGGGGGVPISACLVQKSQCNTVSIRWQEQNSILRWSCWIAFSIEKSGLMSSNMTLYSIGDLHCTRHTYLYVYCWKDHLSTWMGGRSSKTATWYIFWDYSSSSSSGWTFSFYIRNIFILPSCRKTNPRPHAPPPPKNLRRRCRVNAHTQTRSSTHEHIHTQR